MDISSSETSSAIGDDDEYYLPDLPLYEVMSHLCARDLRSCRAVSSRFRSMAGSDRLWRNLSGSIFPPVISAYADSSAFSGAPTAQARHGAVERFRRSMMRAKPMGQLRLHRPQGWTGAPPCSSYNAAVHGPTIFSLKMSSPGPTFCVNAVRGPSGAPAVIAAGASGDVSVVVLERSSKTSESAPERAQADDEDGDDEWSNWTRRVLWPSYKTNELLFGSGVSPSGVTARVACDWHAHDQGMLGMSVDESARDVKGAGPTVITCSFSGEASLWRLNADELSRIKELPAKRLKELLANRGIPYEDLTERSHFVQRIIVSGALPVAHRLAHLEQHRGTVVSSSHAGRIALTSSHDGSIKIYTLDPEFYNNFVPPKKGPRGGASVSSPSVSSPKRSRDIPRLSATRSVEAHASGCDVVSLESDGRFISGGKDGTVASWDLETGRETFRGACGSVWVWCVRSAGSIEGSVGTWADAPTELTSSKCGGGVFSHPAFFLSGDTSGCVRMWDRRARAAVSCIKTNGYYSSEMPPDYVLQPGEGDEAADALSGLVLIPWDDLFVTSGFDGLVRTWDARTMRTLSSTHIPAADSRLARLTMIAPDLFAAGKMDGGVAFCDFNTARGVTMA
jgi:WD40 repeat protein